MHNAIVAMLCGPHEDGQLSYRRIDAAIETALVQQAPLVIVGDGNHGSDLKAFATRATERGVTEVVARYDEDANTLSDVRMIVELLTEPDFVCVERVCLVTDHWHIPRAAVFLFTTMLSRQVGRAFAISYVAVATPAPPPHVLVAELSGISDFLAGCYGSSQQRTQIGKPAHPENVPFRYDSEDDPEEHYALSPY